MFIAKTLLERTGASLSFVNRQPPAHGAEVVVRWPRALIDISGDVEREASSPEDEGEL